MAISDCSPLAQRPTPAPGLYVVSKALVTLKALLLWQTDITRFLKRSSTWLLGKRIWPNLATGVNILGPCELEKVPALSIQ